MRQGRAGPDWEVWIEAPGEVARYVVEKGSIAVDGISLTVARVDGRSFAARVIPHTWEATNLHAARVGDRVNLEADIVAKYVERLIPGPGAGLTWGTLGEAGFLDDDSPGP